MIKIIDLYSQPLEITFLKYLNQFQNLILYCFDCVICAILTKMSIRSSWRSIFNFFDQSTCLVLKNIYHYILYGSLRYFITLSVLNLLEVS